MRFAWTTALAAALYVLSARPANAGFVFQQDFDSGSATFTSDEPSYWLNQSLTNGWIVQTTGSVPGWDNNIPNDVSGTGYFLFDGTGGDNPDPSLSEFYISPTFSVAPDTLYAISFYLTTGVNWGLPRVQPEIDGSLLGTPVSPQGWFGSNGWQQFTFYWNSGSNSTASLMLHNYTSVGQGNDLGIDDISVGDPTPEPGTVALLAVLVIPVAVLRRKRAFQV